MSALAKYSGDDYKRIAHQLKSQMRNAQLDKEKLGRRVSALAFGAASAGGMGFAMGRLHRKGAEEGTLGSDKDPTKLGPAPIAALVGGTLSAIGLFAGGVTKSKKLAWVNDAVESAGSHILAGVIYQRAFQEGEKP